MKNSFMVSSSKCGVVNLSPCQIGAHGKEFVLDKAEQVSRFLIVRFGNQQSYLGIQFVDRAVSFKTGMGLWDAYASYERGRSFITATGIYWTFFHSVYD